jgi:hypothetical protein
MSASTPLPTKMGDLPARIAALVHVVPPRPVA